MCGRKGVTCFMVKEKGCQMDDWENDGGKSERGDQWRWKRLVGEGRR